MTKLVFKRYDFLKSDFKKLTEEKPKNMTKLVFKRYDFEIGFFGFCNKEKFLILH